ncbi:MAG: protein translocase subunit SecD [candidate division KSB1 bacterium]|nr:protein translocase subunit SecD [candidate division KSB1 bacterium]
MRRNNLMRTIIIFAVIIWAVYQLYPTYSLWQYRQQSEKLVQELQTFANLNVDEIHEALRVGLLEARLRESIQDQDKLNRALNIAEKLNELQEKIDENEPKSIKQGLDLLGGTYLVYEVDLPELLRSLSKNPDARFDSLMTEVTRRSQQTDEDFFNVLLATFQEKGIRLNRYFGRRVQTDDQIIDELKKQAEDAVDRTLEVLRNRIDQFGVSEPTITKQGSRRIVIELAGITDIKRAKSLIGKTAVLEFKLLKDPAVFSAVLKQIDDVVKKKIKASGKAITGADTSKAAGTGTKEVGVSALFGESTVIGDSAAKKANDTTVVVEEELFEQNPFFSLLWPIGNEVMVPAKNLRAVQRILNMPEVKNVIPDDAEFLFSSKPVIHDGQEFYTLFFLKKQPEMTGKYITEAGVTIGSGSQSFTQGQPIVTLNMNREGARIFARVTGANVGKRLAIVLDGKVASAPNIKDKIPSGNAIIEGNFSMEEAKELAIVLRAGALPAPVVPIEERTIGPSLGRDSVRRGQISIAIGIILVVVFMMIYYRMSGLIADIALILNLILIMAALAAFGATLTLPGVAGLILTMGMAVDANVLIFERIREELRTGKTVRAAIDAGYSRAFWTIFDANVTTFLTALVLYQFGTGPIRGFAVTLSVGILASMFTAIVVTRVIFDTITQKRTLTKLSI